MNSYPRAGLIVMLSLFCVADPAGAVISRTGQAYGRYGSGNTTHANASFPGTQLGPDDTTGFFGVSNANIDTGGQGSIMESIGVLSTYSGFDAWSAHPADPLNYFIVAGGGVTLIHTINVTSGTLPQFTPVDIRFKVAVAFEAGAEHSFGATGSQSNNAIALGSMSGNITGLSGKSFNSNDNKVVKSTLTGTDLNVGLFAGTQESEFVIQSEVGGTITFSLSLDADANGDVSGVPSPLLNRHGQAWSTIALAYGAEADNGADAQLSVTGPAAPFPDLSQVSFAHAAANLPTNPYTPAPPLIGDLDGDGFVGINDLNIVLGNWNQTVPPADPAADPSGDSFVGIDDLNAVLGNWNAGTPPATDTSIPEPASLTLLGLSAMVLLKRY